MKYLVIFTVLSAVAADLDPRLSVSTLVREDIFAGLMTSDMVRFERGAANVDKILTERPDQRGAALVWKAGATLFHSALARERADQPAYKRFFREATEYYAEAERADPKNVSVIAGTAGSLVILTDRLAPEDQPALWEKCYLNFHKLADLQMPMMDKLPLHLKGELLSGLAQSAQRTGAWRRRAAIWSNSLSNFRSRHMSRLLRSGGQIRDLRHVPVWLAKPATIPVDWRIV